MLNVYKPYHTINKYVSDELAAWQILLMTTGKKQKTQQSTMSEITHQNDDNGNDEFNYSHDSCPTCQDRLIVESYVEGCEDRIFCECCDFAALNVSADGMKSKSWWRSFWKVNPFLPG